MTNVIETNGLTKLYGNLKAVDNVSLNVKKGEIYGFLGLNGAGKTTTIRMLLGMIRPLSGEVYVCGKKIIPGRQGPWDKVGYMVETPYSYPELTVRENLDSVSRLRGLKGKAPADEIIQQLQLNEYEAVKASNLSLGNAQRLGLAKALIHKPEILILDEPSNGLDPAGIVEIRGLLQNLAEKQGTTVFVSSHNLSEISKIAARIGIIHRGALIQEIDADKLNLQLKKTLLIGAREPTGASAVLTQKGFKIELNDNLIKITDAASIDKPEEINTILVQSGFPPYYLQAEQEDLETYFLRLIGQKG